MLELLFYLLEEKTVQKYRIEEKGNANNWKNPIVAVVSSTVE